MPTHIRILCLFVLTVSAAGSARGNGPIVHYAFDERAGTVLHDKTGRGRDATIKGGATWATDLPFGALSFNGVDAVVEGSSDIALTDAGTIEVWCYPREFAGGLVSWHYDRGDAPKPLSLYFDIYIYNRLLGVISDWRHPAGESAANVPEWDPRWTDARPLEVRSDIHPDQVRNRWSHIVMTFDRDSVNVYRNAQLEGSKQAYFGPDTRGLPMRIGLAYPRGMPYFDGLIADVKVYDRALSTEEIQASFAEKASTFHPHLPRRLEIIPRFNAQQREFAIESNLSELSLPDGSTIEAQLLGSSHPQNLTQPVKTNADLTFTTEELTGGEYQIRCVVRDVSGVALAESSRIWRMPKLASRDARPLNNLVAELVAVKDLTPSTEQEFAFINPRKGWVFIACDADLAEGDAVVIELERSPRGGKIELKPGASPGATGETMCFLPEGAVKLKIRAQGKPRVRQLVVRSIPELMLCGYPAIPKILAFGDYNQPFLEKDVLPNVNTIVANWNAGHYKSYAARKLKEWPEERLAKFDMVQRWHDSGRRWIEEQNIPSLAPQVSKFDWKTNPVNEQMAYDWWGTSFGFNDPEWSGTIADEYALGADALSDTWPHRDPRYRTPPFTDAIRRLAASPKFDDRILYIWCGALDRVGQRDHRFVEATRRGGYKLAMEEYLSEEATEEAARDVLYGEVRKKLDRADANFPGIIEDLVLVPGIYSAPPESCDVDPHVDFKVWMDLQMHYMATSPECFGLGGIMWYKSYYADDESLRWMGRLFRHYAIEGNTDPLSPQYGYAYRPGHIENADFNGNLNSWELSEAETGAVRTGKLNTLSWAQGRMYNYHMGTTYLHTKRSLAAPNKLFQAVRNLKPGTIYTAKMMVADEQAIVQNVEGPVDSTARLSVDGAEVLPDRSFVFRINSAIGPGSFDFHRIMFRATAPTAKLTISDWASDDSPGGPAGQELMINYIEVQPYFE